MPPKKTILIISQTFVPDPASVGQHMADVAIELARRGHKVRVYAANRGYEDTSKVYPSRENLHGVDVRRLKFCSFGKKSILTRVIGTASFLIQSLFLCLTTPRLAGIFFSTSPPLVGLAASIANVVRRAPIAYWAMDLNPDQLIAMSKIGPRSFVAWTLEAVNGFILKRSKLIVALDRFMADRLRARGVPDAKMLVMPPWPHENHLEADAGENPFRVKHGLVGKFVVMYSGNHSPANPLRTLLDATTRFKTDESIRFLFVGGGIGKKEVESHIKDQNLTNAISLPYQPLSELKYSLTAADVHVVSLGGDMVGIIHPCKIYGAMAASRPILYFGPRPSHITDLLDKHGFGWQTKHGDVEGAVNMIVAAKNTSASVLKRMGKEAQTVLRENLSQQFLCGRIVDAVEKAFGITSPHSLHVAPVGNERASELQPTT
jgi:colanic acid biosynthesis glycosyl transferase WcaI